MTEQSTSIDELLGPRRDSVADPTNRRRRSRLGWWVRTVLTAAGLTAVVVVGLRIYGVAVSIPAIFAGFLALLVLRRLVEQVTPPPPQPVAPPRDPAFDDGTYRWGTEDVLTGAVHRWERKLAWSKGEPQRFTRGVHPILVELVDERLRLRHGVSRSADPARARALVGDLLWTFLSAPPKRTPAPRDLVALVAEVEKI